MAQDYLKINNVIIATPDEGLGYDFETTYSEDTGRVQNGVLHLTPLFTVESFPIHCLMCRLKKSRKSLSLLRRGKSSTFIIILCSTAHGERIDSTLVKDRSR